MKKKYVVLGLSILLSVWIFTAMDCSIAKERSNKKRAYLGVSVDELNRREKKELSAEFGVIVRRVVIDSPADECGIMEDDVIQLVNDIKIRTPQTLTRIIRKFNPGEKVKITLIRDGNQKIITVVFDKTKNDRGYAFSLGGSDKNLISIFAGERAYLGVRLHELNEKLAPYFGVKADEGALVLEVEEDSPAEKAGLQSGDVITKVNGEKISRPDDVTEILSDLEEDEEVEISIVRKNNSQTIKVILEKREDHRNIFFERGVALPPFHYLPKIDN